MTDYIHTEYIDADELDQTILEAAELFFLFVKQSFGTQDTIRFKKDLYGARYAIDEPHVGEYFLNSSKEYIFALDKDHDTVARANALLLSLENFRKGEGFKDALISFPTWQHARDLAERKIDAQMTQQLDKMERNAPSFWPSGDLHKKKLMINQGDIDKKNITISLCSSDTLYFAIHLWRHIKEDANIRLTGNDQRPKPIGLK